MKCPISYSPQHIVEIALKGGPPFKKMLEVLIKELATCRPLFLMVKSHIVKNRGTREDAEGIFQESLVQLVANLANNKYQGTSSIENYVFGICKFKWLNHLRKRGIDTSEYIPAEQDKPSDANVENDLVQEEMRRILWKIVEQVSGHCPAYLKLWAMGYKHKDIAAKMGVVLVRAEKNTAKCRKKLKIMLEKNPKLMELVKKLRFW